MPQSPTYNQRRRGRLVPDNANPTPAPLYVRQLTVAERTESGTFWAVIAAMAAAEVGNALPALAKPETVPANADQHRRATKVFYSGGGGDVHLDWTFLCGLSRIAYGYPGGIAAIQAVTDGTLTVVPMSGDTPPGVIWTNGKLNVVAVAGTNKIGQVIAYATDFGITTETNEFATHFQPFVKYAKLWKAAIAGNGTPLIDLTLPTIYTGHSLGAAIASILVRSHRSYGQQTKPASGVGFGCPRTCGLAHCDYEAQFNPETDPYPFERLTFAYDPVQYLPWSTDQCPSIFDATRFHFAPFELNLPGRGYELGWPRDRQLSYLTPDIPISFQRHSFQWRRWSDGALSGQPEVVSAFRHYHGAHNYFSAVSRPVRGGAVSTAWQTFMTEIESPTLPDFEI